MLDYRCIVWSGSILILCDAMAKMERCDYDNLLLLYSRIVTF